MTDAITGGLLLDDLKEKACAAIDSRRERLIDLSLRLHDHPEPPFQEEQSAAWLSAELEREGFAVERGLAGLPTAFRGVQRGGADRPVVAILLEYDALPGIGHGCGHNLIASAGLGAGLAVKEATAAAGLPGTLWVLGTPGEEGKGGKVIMVEHGLFADVDAAMMFHPGTHNLPWRHATAVTPLTVRFYGKSAHAAGSPEKGINALNALIQTFVHIDALRQHVDETARIHGIVSHGGDAPNVVPEFAEGQFLVRALTSDYLAELLEKVKDCARGAALATGARVEFEEGLTYRERRNNKVLANAFRDNLGRLGLSMEEPSQERRGTGSSDIGNVSMVCPTIHPYMAVAPDEVPGHSREMVRYTGTPEAQEVMLQTAKALAMTALDCFYDPEVLPAARREFAQAGFD